MIELILGGVLALLAALGWGVAERKGRQRERERADRNERILDIHDQVRDEDRRIDERIREAEGADFEERNERLRNPRDY